ncbi:MAG: ATP-dependent Clp protease proteolytic subunit [Candidatus Cloacimonetes bacterium 4572_55]|nr:MAG: ATP-dependent Clp protease proteolytic subunit [Candidatus Cloacimonetes bacterium 4572_55]
MNYQFNAEEPQEKKQDRLSLQEKLLKSRTITICSEISQKVAKQFMEHILILAEESDDDIKIFLNSQGGHVESGDTIHDMIRFVTPRVIIIGTGWVASAGVLIYLAVSRENRLALPNTRFLIHQPMGGAGGSATDIDIEAREIIKMKARLNRLIAKETGQTYKKVSEDSDRNFWLSAEEAIEYGIASRVIQSADQIPD